MAQAEKLSAFYAKQLTQVTVQQGALSQCGLHAYRLQSQLLVRSLTFAAYFAYDGAVYLMIDMLITAM